MIDYTLDLIYFIMIIINIIINIIVIIINNKRLIRFIFKL